MGKDAFDRRAFLKGAAATAAAVIGTQVAAANTPAQAAESNSDGEKPPSRDKIISRPGSDFMVDVIKATGIEYIA
ncbi:MAG: twin-arginine translocation signal domain-containing protein, partial [Candidatus Binatia bacterium]